MIVYPAIDLVDRACVRLRRGDFAAKTVYPRSPLEQVRVFEDEGAQWVHIVDLDGARDGALRQTDVILDIARDTRASLQVGGGIREGAHIEALLDGGVSRVVVGSTTVETPERAREWLAHFGGDRVALALDVRWLGDVPFPATRGWKSNHDEPLWDLLAGYAESSLRHVLVTDIDCDGMLTGPNLELYTSIARRFPELHVIASGGVSSLADIASLARLPVAGVVVGKALYEERFTLSEALAC